MAALQVLTRLKGTTALQALLLFLSRLRLGTIAYSVKNLQVSMYFLTGDLWCLFYFVGPFFYGFSLTFAFLWGWKFFWTLMWPRYLVYLCLGKKLKNEIAYAFNFCFYSKIHLMAQIIWVIQFWWTVSSIRILGLESNGYQLCLQSQASSVSNLNPELNYSSGFLFKFLFRLRKRGKEISGSRVSKLWIRE